VLPPCPPFSLCAPPALDRAGAGARPQRGLRPAVRGSGKAEGLQAVEGDCVCPAAPARLSGDGRSEAAEELLLHPQC